MNDANKGNISSDVLPLEPPDEEPPLELEPPEEEPPPDEDPKKRPKPKNQKQGRT